MEFIRYRDDRRNLLRIEAKTILVQLKHAPDLQDLIGLYRNDAAWEKKKTAEGIFTQAYAASLTKRNGPNSLPPSNIVVLGNPGLYRVGYTLNGQLVLSKFYSTNPQQALTLLTGPQSTINFTVHQGHLLRQKMALTVVEDWRWFENRAVQRSKPSLSLSSVIAGLVKSTVDCFTRLSEILLRRHRGDLVLNGPCVHVCASRGHPDFLTALPTMKPFRTVKSGHVWGNGSWYLKIPYELDEIKALEELSGEARIPEFGALLQVTTGDHAGKLLVATRAVGEQAGSANDRLWDLDVDMQRDILACLKSIHAAGWHHHDVHPGNVVVSEDGKVTLVDLGRAQLASKCMASQISCADEETIAELSAVESSPSESKETLVEEAIDNEK
ncbi:hypothetical protein B0H13DRAFT_1052100 [Mycena leptocephala]|nr:hypothetical protein B0H13DRAFT_1052100 [Mycena leptocephala]